MSRFSWKVGGSLGAGLVVLFLASGALNTGVAKELDPVQCPHDQTGDDGTPLEEPEWVPDPHNERVGGEQPGVVIQEPADLPSVPVEQRATRPSWRWLTSPFVWKLLRFWV